MTTQTIGLEVNPAEELIRLGPLAVRFLVTGENSSARSRFLRSLSPPESA